METISRSLALFLSNLHRGNHEWRIQPDFRLLPREYEHVDWIAVWPISFGVNINIVTGPLAIHIFYRLAAHTP